MSVAYRAAVRGDAAEIAELFRVSFVDTFGHLYPREDLASFLATMTAARFASEIDDPRYAFRIAAVDGAPVGFIKLGPPGLPVETPAATAEISQLYLLKDWHGTGVAQALCDWALAEATARGANHVQLSVYIDNHRARKFYERYGFVAVGRYDFMVGNHADEDIVLRHTVMAK